MDDVVRETFRRQGWIAAPAVDVVHPRRLADLRSAHRHAMGQPRPVHGARLWLAARRTRCRHDRAAARQLRPSNLDWRRRVFEMFRDPGAGPNLHEPVVPQIFGDAFGEGPEAPKDALTLLAVTPTQYAHLQRWLAGNVIDDWPGAPPVPPAFATLTPAEQVAHLERAALADCLGGPFHPGIELTWTMRLPRVWKRAYRLNVLADRSAGTAEFRRARSRPQSASAPKGPYDGVAAGALTRFMGVPWQTDEASCNSAADYSPWTFLSMPTYWGARVPDQVFAAANYDRAAALDPQALAGAGAQALHAAGRLAARRARDRLRRADRQDGARNGGSSAWCCRCRIRRRICRPTRGSSRAAARTGGTMPSAIWSGGREPDGADHAGVDAQLQAARRTAATQRRRCRRGARSGKARSEVSDARISAADILVAGAGPAGATIARLLALQRATRRAGRSGHAATPTGSRSWRRRGVPWSKPWASRISCATRSLARPCPGIRRRWGTAADRDRRFPAPPGRPGYVIDRARVRRRAARDGDGGRCRRRRRPRCCGAARVRRQRCRRSNRGRRRMSLAAGLVIDATGRPSAVARRMGARRLLSERLVAERQPLDAIRAADRDAPGSRSTAQQDGVVVSGVRSGRTGVSAGRSIVPTT